EPVRLLGAALEPPRDRFESPGVDHLHDVGRGSVLAQRDQHALDVVIADLDQPDVATAEQRLETERECSPALGELAALAGGQRTLVLDQAGLERMAVARDALDTEDRRVALE